MTTFQLHMMLNDDFMLDNSYLLNDDIPNDVKWPFQMVIQCLRNCIHNIFEVER